MPIKGMAKVSMSQQKGIVEHPRALRGALIFLVGWLLVAACGSPPPVPDAPRELGSVRQLLVDEYDALVAPFPDSPEEVLALSDHQVLVFAAAQPTSPVLSDDPQVIEALRRYLHRGGGLLLLGYATRMAYELGLETAPPDRFEPYRWGLDQRTRQGQYRFGIRLVSGQVPDLVAGLRAEEDRPHVYMLGGGELVSVQSCHWEGYRPKNGEVLAQLSRERDGEPADLDGVVLSRWREGRGVVLGYGSLPEPWRAESLIGENARQFLRNALRVVHGAEPDSVALCLAGGDSSEPTRALLPFDEREIPGQPLISHWGWQAGLNYLHDVRDPMTPTRILDEVMLPSWRAGADLLDLHLPDPDRGYPLDWQQDDRLSRPSSFWGGSFWPEWSTESVRALAREAHARSMLVQTWLAPAPVRSSNTGDSRVGDSGVGELLDAMRWLGRELLDIRDLGPGALDGIGVQGWFRDPQGLTVAALQDYHPGSHFYSTDRTGLGMPGSVPVMDANRGRPRGLNAAGISSVWRQGVYQLGFAAAMLDCRTRLPSLRLWGNDHALGGGSYGDWIVTQANDFVRNRLGHGPTLWWQSFNPATMDPSTLAYVHGISGQPIVAAVAARLWATGTRGYRELLADSVPDIQSGFGAEVSLDASSHFLQNNHFRLHGSGGALLLDPGGLARFRVGEGDTLIAASEFMRTRMFGSRPSAAELRSEEIDFLGGGTRPESGYGDTVTLVGAERGARGFPAVLAREEAPRWPRRVDISFHPGLGLYELEIGIHSVVGDGMLELRRDGELVHVLGFGPKRQRHVLPFHVARAGERQLSIEVVDGGSVAIDALRLVRRGDVAAEGAIGDRAGHLASLEESTASSYHADRARITALADLPGFTLFIDHQRISRSLRVERQFGLLHHTRLARSTDGEGPEHLRGPFILASDVPGMPDLAVVPIGMAAYDHFSLRDGQLVLTSQPRAYQSLVLGFLFLEDGDEATLPHLHEVFTAMHAPRTLDLGGSGSAVVRSDLPIPWVRALKLHNPWGTPYMVRENGWWIHRGGQPSTGGGEWLRVYQLPGDEVQILAGPELLRRTRPGPGSLRSVALKNVRADRVLARVLQVDPLTAAPSVTMAAGFDEVWLNGEPWSYFDESTIYLPKRTGDYEIETRNHGAGQAPHVVRTRAVVRSSSYDPIRRILTVSTASSDGRPSDLPYTAVIAGGQPTSLQGCVRVPERELTYRDEADENRALARGIVVRFRPGVMTIHYGGDR